MCLKIKGFLVLNYSRGYAAEGYSKETLIIIVRDNLSTALKVIRLS